MQNKEKRFYKIGGLVIGYEGPRFEEKNNLQIFRTNEDKADIYYQIEMKHNISLPDISCVNKGKYIHVYQNEEKRIQVHYHKDTVVIKDICKENGNHIVEYEEEYLDRFSDNLLMKIWDFPHQILRYGGVFLHASYIMWDGKAILFTAPKQTGKSTQAALWERYKGAEIVNGDRALIRKTENGFVVYGSPYSGTSGISKNIASPLGAIVILEQAKENVAKKAAVRESVMALMDGCSFYVWDREEISKVTEIANNLIMEIPFYKLSCLPDRGAVDVLEEVLCQERKEL